MSTKLFTVTIVFLITFHYSFTQGMDLTGSSMGVHYTALPVRPFKDTSGGFGYQAFGGNISIPLFGNRNNILSKVAQGEKPGFYQVSLHAGFELLDPTIGFITDQRNLYTSSAGFGSLFYNGKKNIMLIDASMGFAGDGLTIKNNDIQYRFSGSFIINHIHSASVMYQYGIVFTYAYGTPLPLPVLGIRKKFSTSWSFSAILPVSLQFTNKLNKEMSLSFSLRPAGNRFQFQNHGDFNTGSSTVYMQLRQFQLGISYLYRFTKQFSIGAEAGVLGGGNLKFTEQGNSKDVLYQTAIKGGAKFRLSLRYHLPHKKPMQNNMDIDEEMPRVN